MPPALARFADAAARRPAAWRILAGLVLIGAVYMGGLLAASGALFFALGRVPAQALLGRVAAATEPGPMLAVLASFAFLAAGPPLAARLVHRRPAASLFGPRARVVGDFLRMVAVVALVYGLAALLLPGDQGAPHLPPLRWAALLPLALAGVLLQTGAEELVFRGYLLQQMAARFRWRLAWMLLPSLVFGALHFDPTAAVPVALGTMAAIALFGLVAADLTARTGSLGASWGFHFANNVMALLVVAPAGQLSGLSLRIAAVPKHDAGAMLPLLGVDVVLLLVLWGLGRLALRR